jgi:hypothetical protein
MLHKAERRTTTTRVVKETETEAIAFVIGNSVGLEIGTDVPKGLSGREQRGLVR